MNKRVPHDFPKEFTFKDLSDWYVYAQPEGEILMTLEQEMWYRQLLPPICQTYEFVTFRGHKIICQ